MILFLLQNNDSLTPTVLRVNLQIVQITIIIDEHEFKKKKKTFSIMLYTYKYIIIIYYVGIAYILNLFHSFTLLYYTKSYNVKYKYVTM